MQLISDLLISCAYKDNTLKEKLEIISDFLYQNFEIKIYFCEILAQRWSYIAGDNDILVIDKQQKITPRYGIIAENQIMNDKDWAFFLQMLEKYIFSAYPH